MIVRFVLRVVFVALLAVGAAAVVSPQPAFASCAEIPDIEDAFADAEVVFVGVVTDLSNNDRTVTMQVEQVWKGPALPETVVVNGGPVESNAFTSVDRTYEFGTYIVFPVNSTPPFADNACTLTQRTTAALDAINPFKAETTEQTATSTQGVVTTTIAAVGISQGPGIAEGPVSGEPATGEAVLVDGGTNLIPIVVSGLIVIVALGVAIFIWRRRSTRQT